MDNNKGARHRHVVYLFKVSQQTVKFSYEIEKDRDAQVEGGWIGILCFLCRLILNTSLIWRWGKAVSQVLVKWSGWDCSLAIWEDEVLVKQHFPSAPTRGLEISSRREICQQLVRTDCTT